MARGKSKITAVGVALVGGLVVFLVACIAAGVAAFGRFRDSQADAAGEAVGAGAVQGALAELGRQTGLDAYLPVALGGTPAPAPGQKPAVGWLDYGRNLWNNGFDKAPGWGLS